MSLLDLPLARQKGVMRAAMICAGLAALAAVGLLGVAGWFLVGAAVASAAGAGAVSAFNYLLPSAAIRAAAIIRTGGRYGERMLGHRAALFALADLRMALFSGLAQAALMGRDPGRSGMMAARFGRDVDLLEDAAIRRVARVGAWAGALMALAIVAMLGWRSALVMGLGMTAMRVAGRMMAKTLPPLQARAAQAHAAIQADYADMAVPTADIAVYELAPRMVAALQNSAAVQAQAEHVLARAEARLTSVQTILAGMVLVVIVLVAKASAPVLALGLLAAMAGLEAWAGLASHDARAGEVLAAEHRLSAIGAAPAVKTSAPVTENPVLTICGQVLAPGSRLAIAGPSGVGKTRLMETLAGLRSDAPQRLMVDGMDPRELGLTYLRQIFALMPQDAPLIAGNIADNLALAHPGITREAMEKALWIACADDVVRALPDGLVQWLGGDGARLSGGQRRRIALARSLLAQRPWLMLDEPSEGLDAATEALLIDRLGQWLDQTGTGLILISHRPAMMQLTHQTIAL